MTADQIQHLDVWLSRNQKFTLSIGRWNKKTFLRIVAEEPVEHDQEVFYIPLDPSNADTHTLN